MKMKSVRVLISSLKIKHTHQLVARNIIWKYNSYTTINSASCLHYSQNTIIF